MFEFFKKLFGFDGVADTALKIVDKIAGTDWTPEQKAKFMLDYQLATKHQSPARRFIATLIIIEQFILILGWLVASVLFRCFDLVGAGMLATDISLFLESNVNITLNIIVSFYFIVHFKK